MRARAGDQSARDAWSIWQKLLNAAPAPLELESGQHHCPALVDPAHDIGERDAHVVKEDFAVVDVTVDCPHGSDLNTGGVHIADHPGQSLVPPTRSPVRTSSSQ
jgi:hypothetical protein